MATKGSKSTAKKTTTRKPSNKRTTAGKSRSKSRGKKKQQSLLERAAELVVRKEVFGLLLVALSVLTLLSLLTGSRGKLTDAWIDYLDQMVGMGAWGVPLVLGAIGVWMVIRSIDQMSDIPWQKPVGLLLILVAFVTGASLFAKMAPEQAGGLLGSLAAKRLAQSIGESGSWAIVSIVAIAGVVLLTDRLLVDAGYELWWRLQDWRKERSEQKKQTVVQPSLPIPSGDLPWWKRVHERFGSNEEDSPAPPPNLVPADPHQSSSGPDTGAKPETPSSPKNSSPQPTSEPSAAGPSSNSVTGASRAVDGVITPSANGRNQTWELPAIADMLNDWDRNVESDELIRSQGRLIQETLGLFGVPADFEGAYKGPSVTQYLIKPGYVERTVRGEQKRVKVKVSKIAGLSNDLALALAAPSVRIEAPVPGTNYIGVEVPNLKSNIVGLKELMESDAFRNLKGKLPVALGEDVKGQPIVTDLARMPHLLIAGATGSGKSVCINSIITCLLLTHSPDTLRLLMIDPKMVELNVYNGIPHLLSPVVTEVDRAAGVLFWTVKEMERRYQLFSQAKARDINRYNEYLQKRKEKPLPYIVVVVDEMADLMMASPEEVEKHICRLAQMARAVGIHLIIATQRPSVDVITGLIKANFPARIAFAVSSQVDSRVILDLPGADRLLGHGDMLFMAPDTSKLERVQGAFLSDDEIMRVVRYWIGVQGTDFIVAPDMDGELDDPASAESTLDSNESENPFEDQVVKKNGSGMAQPELFAEIEQLQQADARDELYEDAVRIVLEAGRGSVNLLQRKLRIGYGRASRLIEQLETAGILGPDLGGNQGREIVIAADQAEVENTTEPAVDSALLPLSESQTATDLHDAAREPIVVEADGIGANAEKPLESPVSDKEPVDKAASDGEPVDEGQPTEESDYDDERTPRVWM